MSAENKDAEGRVLFFVVSAPSGAGKTSLCKWLIERDLGIAFSVSHTTRPPRRGELEGADYYFVDDAIFDRMIREGKFLEWANVYGHRYGTSRGEIERAKAVGKDLLIEIDCQGAEQLRKVLPEAIRIFILPPSLESLKQRLRERSTESEEEIARRLSIAIRELSDYPNFQYAVINDDFERAARQMESIIQAERIRMNRQQAFIEAMLRSSGVGK